MELLKQRILKDGTEIGTEVVKVDSFLNHQLDIGLFMALGKEIHRRFGHLGINKILTIEASGIGIAAIAAAKGYKAIIVMPENMSEERKLLMKAYGAELVLTPAAQGMRGALAKADEIKAANPGSIIAGQFTNPANPQAHYRSTAPEIWDDTDGKVDVLVAGVGTGGTISGIGKYLKEKNPSIHIVAVEPANSPLLSQGKAGAHGLMGIGANFVPETLDQNIYDEIITVAEEDAYHYGRQFAAKEGILVGITSGAALSAAAEVAKRENFKGKNIVAILPDSGERYLTTPMFK